MKVNVRSSHHSLRLPPRQCQLSRMRKPRQCTFPGCGRSQEARGLFASHTNKRSRRLDFVASWPTLASGHRSRLLGQLRAGAMSDGPQHPSRPTTDAPPLLWLRFFNRIRFSSNGPTAWASNISTALSVVTPASGSRTCSAIRRPFIPLKTIRAGRRTVRKPPAYVALDGRGNRQNKRREQEDG
jgi:hypothetical protein